MDTEKAQELLAKHRAGTLTSDERYVLESWYNELSANQLPADLPADLLTKRQQDFAAIERAIKPRTVRLWPRIAAAASIILAISAGGYLVLHKKAPVRQT